MTYPGPSREGNTGKEANPDGIKDGGSFGMGQRERPGRSARSSADGGSSTKPGEEIGKPAA
jgi:hypothetical protein